LVRVDDGWLVHGLGNLGAELNWGRRTVVRGVGEASNLWCPMVVRRVALVGTFADEYARDRRLPS
jgi:hypothetical protein